MFLMVDPVLPRGQARMLLGRGSKPRSTRLSPRCVLMNTSALRQRRQYAWPSSTSSPETYVQSAQAHQDSMVAMAVRRSAAIRGERWSHGRSRRWSNRHRRRMIARRAVKPFAAPRSTGNPRGHGLQESLVTDVALTSNITACAAQELFGPTRPATKALRRATIATRGRG